MTDLNLDLNTKLNQFMNLSGIESTMNTSIKGIFLLILSVASNYNAETLGCRTQKFLTESMYGKHFLNLALIYFAINLTDDKALHPNIILQRTFIVWFGYLLFIRMPLNSTIFVFMLFVLAYGIGNYIDFFSSKQNLNEKEEIKNNRNLKMFKSARNLLFNIIIITLITSSIYYIYLKKLEYGNSFNFIKFIFGNNVCKSLK